MVNPTWQDKERRIIYVPTEFIKLDNPLALTTDRDHGELVVWNESKVTVKLDGMYEEVECLRKNLFWEDKQEDFDEVKSIGANDGK